MTLSDSNNNKQVCLLDYGAGNVRSLINAIEFLGYTVRIISTPNEIALAERLVFPGVGAFGSAMKNLNASGFAEPLKEYIRSGKPFFGICLGMQTLFEESEESPGVKGLGIIPSKVQLFPLSQTSYSVPHMGWNQVIVHKPSHLYPTTTGLEQNKTSISTSTSPSSDFVFQDRYYFVHSFVALPTVNNLDWICTTTDYGGCRFISSIQKGNVFAAQFHPEKSGSAGLNLILRFLSYNSNGSHLNNNNINTNNNNTNNADSSSVNNRLQQILSTLPKTVLAPRIIACLDVRANDDGDLVVTKGDQYDVREKSGSSSHVRNLGKPVQVAKKYFEDGADEIVFLNITSFRNSPLKDFPMLEVLKQTSQSVFVPLTIGGGIRDVEDPDGTKHSALEVANEYFRSGADKVSIGSDAVTAAEEFLASNGKLTGLTAIEQIARVYGRQAVVVSVDPKRVYVPTPSSVAHHTFETKFPGPNGEKFVWYQCTVKGGRETRDIGAYELARACEALGAGEILLNCIDKDGTNSGFDLELISDIKKGVSIPVVASSGAGAAEHFEQVLNETGCDAALAAGIFHRQEVPLPVVKKYLDSKGIVVRL